MHQQYRWTKTRTQSKQIPKPPTINEPYRAEPHTSQIHLAHSRPFSTTNALTTMDDASYNTFLTRANQDLSSGGTNKPDSTSQARSKFDPSSSKSTDHALPASLTNLDATYTGTSEEDVPFEPVFLSYASHELPDSTGFKGCLGAKADKDGVEVEEMTVAEFDPKGEYADVIRRVGDAGSEARTGRQGNDEGKVKVFRVVRGTRVEYYVITVGDRALVGVVARAVES